MGSLMEEKGCLEKRNIIKARKRIHGEVIRFTPTVSQTPFEKEDFKPCRTLFFFVSANTASQDFYLQYNDLNPTLHLIIIIDTPP